MRVLILTTDAGGGHRSAARALAAGFEEVDASCQTRVVDFLAGYAPFPLSRTRELYSFFMHHPFLYGMFYASTNTRDGWVLNAPALGLAMEAGMRRLLREHVADVIVATHPMGAPALTSLLYRRKQRLPYYTVVTDFGGVHTWWAYPFGELWFVPSGEVADWLVRGGIPEERVVVSGFPVHPRFARPRGDPAEARRALGLEPERFTALVMGGVEGVGPLEETVQALAAEPAPWQLIVIAGRNRALAERLEAQRPGWAVPVRVEGLVEGMPARMHAADVLVTKAGGSTLSEGMACGLPALLYGVLPGQEEGNARHFERLGTARRLAEPAEARAVLEALAAPGSRSLADMREQIRREARPAASLEIARRILDAGKTATAAPIPPLFGLQMIGSRTLRWREGLRPRPRARVR